MVRMKHPGHVTDCNCNVGVLDVFKKEEADFQDVCKAMMIIVSLFGEDIKNQREMRTIIDNLFNDS